MPSRICIILVRLIKIQLPHLPLDMTLTNQIDEEARPMTLKVLSRWRPEFAKPKQEDQPQKQSSTPAPSNPNAAGAKGSNGIDQAPAPGAPGNDLQHQQQGEQPTQNTAPAPTPVPAD